MEKEIQELISNSLLGYFNTIELIEIIGVPKENSKESFNIFSIMIACENKEEAKKTKLTQKLIKLKSEKKIKIGIFKSILNKDELISRLSLLTENTWENRSGEKLNCGKLNAIPKVFVPINDLQEHDFQGLLKNNFRGGSYVFEWFDESKQWVRNIVENPDCLSEISEQVQKYLPIEIGRFSDRLGNFVLQIPCLSVSVRMQGRNRHNHHFTLDLAVNPELRTTELKLSGVFWREERGIFTDICRQALQLGQNEIPFKQINGSIHWLVFDDLSGQICSGGITNQFIEHIQINITLPNSGKRTFYLPDNRENNPNRVDIKELVPDNEITGDYRKWIDGRVFQNEKKYLKESLRLLQFRKEQHENALETIRTLLTEHGKYGAYLWDPYLSADDLLKTLFFCPYAYVPLRALSGLKTVNGSYNQRQKSYRQQLDELSGNQFGLDLIFLKADSSEISFHDRFLIFPRHISRSARVWSLGTSVNSIGKSHHIIQEVGDGQIIADEFETMWKNSIKNKANIIWQNQSHLVK